MRREVISLCGCRIELCSVGQGSPLVILPGAGGARLYENLATHFGESFRVFLPQNPGSDAADDADWLSVSMTLRTSISSCSSGWMPVP
jgi:hypothetical protein